MSPSRETCQPFASILLVALYQVTVVSPVLVATFAVPQTDHSLLSEIAKNSGLVGIGILLMQFVLAGRFRLICDVFSLSDVMIFHRSMGILAIVLLLLHPVLLAAGERNWPLLYGWNQSWDIWVGKVALLLLLTHVFVSVFRAAVKLSYERWRQLHDTLAVAIIGLTFATVLLISALLFVVALRRAGETSADGGHQHSHDHTHGEASLVNSPQSEKSHDHAGE